MKYVVNFVSRQTGQDNPEEISTKSFRLPESTDKTELEESQNLDIDISVEEEISSVLSNESDGDHFDDVSVEDETELLMRELEKIKREREEARKAEEVKTDLEAIHGNPLLAPEPSFSVKRRWDDDVVFKNQYKGLDNTAKKRFINDTTRSDFHRKFLDKYIK